MQITTVFDPNEIPALLQQEADAVRAAYMRGIADEADSKMAEVMLTSVPVGRTAPGGGKRSEYGQPPAIESRELVTSLQSRLVDENTVEVEMAAHGYFLDPIFVGDGKGGGYLNRPFIEKGLQKAFIETAKKV